MVPFSHTYLVFNHRIGCVNALDSPSLASGHNLNFTSNNMAYPRYHDITVNDENDPYPGNIPYQLPHHVNPLN